MNKQFDFGNSAVALGNLLGESNTVKAIQLPIENIEEWYNQPFKEHSAEQLTELVDSIERYGLFHNPVVRKLSENRYQILSGHNRIKACRLLKWTTVPCIIKENLSDDEAEEILLDSNLNQRQLLSHKEKILSYSRVYALRKKLRNGTTFNYQDDVRTVQRYAQMGNLIPAFIEMIDQNKLKLGVAYELSFLDKKAQELVELHMINYDIKLTTTIAKQLREVDTLTEDSLLEIMYQVDDIKDKYKLISKAMAIVATKELPINIELNDLHNLIEFMVEHKVIK